MLERLKMKYSIIPLSADLERLKLKQSIIILFSAGNNQEKYFGIISM